MGGSGQSYNGGSVRTDPTFYRSAGEAVAAPPEELSYVVAFDRLGGRHDALTVLDVDESSVDYAKVVGWTDLPTRGDELHHFGWNACSSALMHAGHDMGPDGLQRRFLLLPGLRSSRTHVFDTQPTRARPGCTRRSRRPSWRARPGTRAPTPCTAARTGCS